MKKFFLVVALAVTGMAFANGFNPSHQQPKAQLPQDLQKVQFGLQDQILEADGSFNWQDQYSILKMRKKLQAEYADADQYFANYAFHLGIYEGLGGYNLGIILFPLLDSVEYINYYGPTDWTVNGRMAAENSETYVTDYWVNGSYYVPETSDHDLKTSTKTYKIKGSKYGIGTNAQYVFSAVESKFLNGENAYLTLCGMETDTLLDTSDFWMVGGGLTNDTYLNGTGIHLDGDNRDVTADTLGILVSNHGVMKIEQILFPIYNGDKNGNALMPNDAKLRLAIFPWTDKGIDFSDTIAATVMTKDDFISAGSGYEWVGTLHAKFYETDIFGETTQSPVWVEGDFYVQLTNFNETGCDFGIFCDVYNAFTGTTVYQHDGMFSYRESKYWGGEYGQNLGVSFDAYFPTLAPDTAVTTLYADVAGSPAYYGDDADNYGVILYSNVNYEEWTVETDDDWIEPAIVSTDYWEDYSAIVLAFEVAALPAGVDGRKGYITIEADGARITYKIIQGDYIDAVENTRIDFINDGKYYNILGVEVGEDYKGVVIRNGQKFIR